MGPRSGLEGIRTEEEAAESGGPRLVRVTLRPLRSEERVRLSVEYGSRVGELRILVEQKYGVAPPAKLLRMTKQRQYVSCEDSERIKQDRILHVKDVDWLQDPSAPSKPLVTNNPDAFVDPPWLRKKREGEVLEPPPSAPAGRPEPVEEVHKINVDNKKEIAFFRVVHTHVWVRTAPNVEARRLGLLERDKLVSGRVVNGWLNLDNASRQGLGDDGRGPAWALIDGRDMGYGLLLDKVAVGAVDKEKGSSISGVQKGKELMSAQGRWKAAAALAGLDDDDDAFGRPPARPAPPRAAPREPPWAALAPGAAAWLVVPEEAPLALPAAVPNASLEEQRLDMDALYKKVSARLECLNGGAAGVLLELLGDQETRRQAKEALELLYGYERVREMRASREAGAVAAPSSAPPPAAVGLAPASLEAPEAEAGAGEAARDDRAEDRPQVPSAASAEESPQPAAADPVAIRMAALRAEDPFRLCQVFTMGWRYGEWYQDTDKFRQRAPFGMLRGALQEDLLAYLLDRAPFNAVSEEAHVALRKKYRMAKEKFDGKNEFVKADWHTVPGLPEVAEVFVPRHGARGPALRAPDHVAAFAEAFRDANAHAWKALAERLRGGLAPKGKEELEGLGSFFAEALENRRHFGAVELQHFAGQGFEGKRHIDGCTSTLHLAVSLGGRRRLHVHSAPNKTAAECQEEVYEMLPGDVYLSSPATFQHKVVYPTCGFNDGMVSLHMRFLFEPHWWLKKWVNQLRDNDMREINSAVADTLVSQRLRLPSLAEVKHCEARLRELSRH